MEKVLLLSQADGGYVIPHPISLNTNTGLYTSRSELFISLAASHFNETGQLSVRCQASIGNNKTDTLGV